MDFGVVLQTHSPSRRTLALAKLAEEHGWYAFVWTFPGDDRVMPAASAYDDQWEQARVIEELTKRDEKVKDDEEGEVQTEEAEDAN